MQTKSLQSKENTFIARSFFRVEGFSQVGETLRLLLLLLELHALS
jgi:hypothetical protein